MGLEEQKLSLNFPIEKDPDPLGEGGPSQLTSMVQVVSGAVLTVPSHLGPSKHWLVGLLDTASKESTV